MGRPPFGADHYRPPPRHQSPRGRSPPGRSPRDWSPRGRSRRRPSPRENYGNRHSSRPANDGYRWPRRDSMSPRRSPSRSPARRQWYNNGRNFTAPNAGYHQYTTEGYGHHQHHEGNSPGTLGEITNQSPLPSPGMWSNPNRPPKEDDEDSLFVSDGRCAEYIEDDAETESNLPVLPVPKTRPTENQNGGSEYPDAFHRRPEPISRTKIAVGMYFPAIGKPILKPMPSKPNAEQRGENILEPKYISTTNIRISSLTAQEDSASKKPDTGSRSNRKIAPKPPPTNTDTSTKASALAKGSNPPKAAAPSTIGNNLPFKLPTPHPRFLVEQSPEVKASTPPKAAAPFLVEQSPEPTVPRPPPTSTNLATSGDSKLANQEPQQSVHAQSLNYPDLRLPDRPKSANTPDSKPSPTLNRSSIRNRKAGDPFSPGDLQMIWNQCFSHRFTPDAARLGYFALPIPSHALHLVSPEQLGRARRYLLLSTIQFEVLPLQPGGNENKIPLPNYHKLQLRPSHSILDGLSWPILRAMQIAWEVTARWYKKVIVDEGWNAMGRMEQTMMIRKRSHGGGNPMDIDGGGEEENKNDFDHDWHDDILNNPANYRGLGDYVATEVRRDVVKTKIARDEPSGTAEVDREIGRWMDHIQHMLN
ncbi:hypothetical protein B0T20DRAFT_446985 [Sordaria brevicollis]|uniref:Uncharacterized protein n=1 Tax=Sordaria brevicollis TaxID=83679 RepID=A0AAE0P1N6_SORBR|nr:hypothetical protein B0T20DRAFT_446985 [Sordaria brevicollis]